MKHFRALAWSVVALALASPARSGEMATTPSTSGAASQPTSRPSPESLKAMSDLASHPKLLLTNDAHSAHERYSFAIVLSPPPDGPAQSTTVLVVRDGAHVGVVVGARGLPAYYMTDGLLVGVDPKNPGHLMMHEGGSMCVHFAGKDDGDNLGYSPRAKDNRILVDPGALIHSIAPSVSRADYRPDLRRIGLTTEAGDQLRIRLAALDKVDAYPIDSLMFQSPGPKGLTFAFGNVTPGAVMKRSIALRSAEDVRKLGLPIRMLTDEDLAKDYSPLARADFAENEEEQEAAEKLRALFPDDVAP